MKRSQSRILLALTGYLFAMAAGFLVPTLSQPVRAGAAAPLSLTFFYDLQDKTEIQSALGGSALNGLGSNVALNKTAVYAKGSTFGSTPFQFQFARTGTGGSAPTYEATYYCTKGSNGNDPSGFSSANEGGNNDIEIVLSATPKLSSTFINAAATSPRSVTGNLGFVSATRSGATVSQASIPAACQVPGLPRNVTISNYNLLSAATKGTWPSLQTTAQGAAAASSAASGSASTGSAGVDQDAASQCPKSALGLGWIICPFIGLVNDLFASTFQKFIVGLMHIDPLDTSDQSANLYLVWKNIRDLANVLFLLIFMIIVLANTMSFDIQAYTLKKMIPKLVAAAVLVQFSFIISAVLIDVFNIIGGGLGDLLSNLANIPGDQGGSFLENLFGTVFSALSLVLGGVLGVIAVKSFGGNIVIGFVIVIALTAFFAFISLVFTLMFRKMIIVMLILMSPLAFAALVLPSTEKMFKVWMKTFIQILMMYPMIVFLFSSATVLQQALGSTGNDVNPSVGIPELMAAIMPIIVCFMVPYTFKAGGKLMSAGAGAIGGLSAKIGGSAVGKFRDSAAYQVPRQIRADDKLDRRQARADAYRKGQGGTSPTQLVARARGRVAVAQTRGDYTGTNTRLRTGIDRSRGRLDPRRYLGTEQHDDMLRKENLLRRERQSNIMKKLVELDESRLEELMQPLLEAHHTGNWGSIGMGEVDMAELAAGAFLGKTGRTPQHVLDALTAASEVNPATGQSNIPAYDAVRAGQGYDAIIDQNLHKLEQSDPISATTARRRIPAPPGSPPGTPAIQAGDFIETIDAVDYNGTPTGGRVKVIGHDQYGAERLRSMSVSDLGNLDEVGIQNLADNFVETEDGRRVRAIDYMLEQDPNLIYTLRRNTAYGRLSPGVKNRIIEHGRESLPVVQARLATLAPGGVAGTLPPDQQAEFERLTQLHNSYTEATVFGTAGRQGEPVGTPGV
ncbi:MAG TPA: hypothetical protein VMR98_01760 [Candidatus Polarisedimenticolaceae bacterium]|nr:hypothetical protein [Candidatus Polarisedimenticolaceae bacterium]